MTTNDLSREITILARYAAHLYAKNLDYLGLGYGQSQIIRKVMTHKELTQDQIAALLHIDKTTVSRAVKSLVDGKYLKKIPHPRDGRSHLVVSTPGARSLSPLIFEVDGQVSSAMLGGFSDEEREDFTKFTRKATVNLRHVLHSPPERRQMIFTPQPEGF